VTTFNVSAYPGVDPSGRTKSSGLQVAINDVARRSSCTRTVPCTLYFPAGTYLAKQLFLRSKFRLYLVDGAKLEASTDPADYQLDPETHRTAFITADNVFYTGIAGPGAIDGNGLAYRKRNNATSPYPYRDCRSSTKTMCWDSPQLVLIKRSNHVTVSDVMMLDPAAWTNHILYSDRVTYSGVKILDDRTKFNNDGVDVDASTNVTVQNSFFHGRDDAFCIKSTGENGLLKPSTNISFLDNTVGFGENAAKLGTETLAGGDMDAVTIRNLYVTRVKGRPFGIFVRDGNTVGPSVGISLDGVYVDTAGVQGFAIQISKRSASSAIGRVQRIALANFNLPAAVGTSTIQGQDTSHRVSNVTITRYRVGGVPQTTLAGARITKNAYTDNISIR
jgi:polygalacturonase